MKTNRIWIAIAAMLIAAAPAALAGPYTEAGVAGDDESIVGWATGYLDYLPAEDVTEDWQTPGKALGAATGDVNDVVSLGECSDLDCAPGEITMTFADPIGDGDGADFAVFENGFLVITSGQLFGELGFVEVSTDGDTFVRFPAVSLLAGPIGPFASFDPTEVYNLAGKHGNGNGTFEGTPFDLAELADDPDVLAGDVDLGEINYVRIVDVPGFGGYLDSLGNPIYDPNPTIGSAGFDLEAIGVINEGAPAIAVELDSFIATVSSDTVTATWLPSVEVGITGYALGKATSAAGPFTTIRTAPALGAGVLYGFDDEDVEAGTTYYYNLTATDVEGGTHVFGPVSATIPDTPNPGCGVLAKSDRIDLAGIALVLAGLLVVGVRRRG